MSFAGSETSLMDRRDNAGGRQSHLRGHGATLPGLGTQGWAPRAAVGTPRWGWGCVGVFAPSRLAPLTPLLLQRQHGGDIMRQVEEREHAEAGEAQRQLPELHSRQGAVGARRSGQSAADAAWPLAAAVGAGRGGRGASRAAPPSAPQVGSGAACPAFCLPFFGQNRGSPAL